VDIIELLNLIKRDWALLAIVFTLGGGWMQGQAWFKKINDTLEKVGKEHKEQSEMLELIHQKTELLELRTDKIETVVNQIHEKDHEQEVKLAVLESTRSRRKL
jgi:hypothetical protein